MRTSLPRQFTRAGLTLLGVACVVFAFGAPAQATIIPTVTIGNPGNGNDAATGKGAVSTAFNIGTSEVTNAQYAAFLNAVAVTDAYNLYNGSMASGAGSGITQSGSPGSYSYTVNSGRGDKPVAFVDSGDAMRFANWMDNGQPTGVQDASTTEDGAYTLSGATSAAALAAIARNTGSTWWLPSENEWYKAAYHKNDGVTSNYWSYPTATNTAPGASAPTATPNQANYAGAVGDTTDGGAYTASASAYGTFDQGGNVWEWTDTVIGGSSRYIRGGGFFSSNVNLSATDSPGNYTVPADFQISSAGFRVATIVPEPGSFAMLLFGAVMLWTVGRKRTPKSKC
jgi:formylglycine-generating enzyme required for sulfatase activity